MFSVATAGRAIPTIREVPLTPEERDRQRRARVLRAALAVVLGIVAVLVAWRFYRHRERVEACATAEASGRIADIDAALALLSGDEGPAEIALRARLLATAVLSGETDRRAEAEALLARHDAAADGASDHRIAAAYLALAAADPAGAAREAALLVAGRGPRAAEAAHARARTALAIGNLEAAEAAAEAARSDMAGSPRHDALLYDIMARRGEPLPAAGANDATVLRAARARAALDAGELDEARTEAQRVLDAADATRAERAWAELVVAAERVASGDTVAALASLERATATLPPGDELFTIVLCETYVTTGRVVEAERAVATFSEEVSTDAGRRSLLSGRRALARGDTSAAATAIAAAPEGPGRTLVEAEIAAASGDTAAAERLYTTLLGDARFGLSARLGLGRALARAGRRDEAWTTLEPALAEHPESARVVAAAASVLAARGERERAEALLAPRLEALPREPLLLLERARIHAQAAEWPAALEALDAAAETSPTDAVLQLERGLAARAVTRFDVAIEALTASLAARPGNAQALIALFSTQIETHALDDAERTNADIEAAGLVSPDIDTLRARFFVEALAGAAGIPALEAAVGRSPDDGSLRLALATLEYQAERWEDAADGYFAAANRLPDERHAALARRALSLARARRRPTVEAVLEQIRRDAPIAPNVLAIMAVAEGWLERHDDALGRAGIFARLGADRDPTSADATFLLAVLDTLSRRDASDRLREVAGVSLEAVGMLALAGPAGDAAGCAGARRYLRGAPAGRLAPELGAWVAGCPAVP